MDDVLGTRGHETVKTYLHVGLNEREMVHVRVVQGRLCSPNVSVRGPQLAPTFADGFPLGGTLLRGVPGVGELGPGGPGGQAGGQRAPPVAAQAGA